MTDAHCHPFDLAAHCSGAEQERQALNVVCAASAWNIERFLYHETLAGVRLCFAVHPQLPAGACAKACAKACAGVVRASLDTLYELAEAGRLDAVGETGFDLYNEDFRNTEKIQDELFAAHLELAIAKDLPLVLHVRRAMHKVFAHTNALKKARALIFHSWSGTPVEGISLLKRGVNAYFSIGTPVMLNHKEVMRSAATFPADRLLLETDAPYQPLRGQPFSRWTDLSLILRALSRLREAPERAPVGAPTDALEAQIDANFHRVFADSHASNRFIPSQPRTPFSI
jgi:TatD DNase family protein